MIVGAVLSLLALASSATAVAVTGCSCNGYSYTFTTQAGVKTTNSVLYRKDGFQDIASTNPDGWCFAGGVMTARDQARITSAIESGIGTDYVNSTWALYECQQLSYTTTVACANAIISIFTKALIGADGSKTTYITQGCNYPTSNFNVLDCSCGFACNDGYVLCGTNNCIDPTTTACQSGSPVPLRKRRGLECSFGQTKCNNKWGSGWECLDTMSNLEACGGCPGDVDSLDCSAIPGVSSVQCVSGQCVIASCDNYHHLVGDTCIPKTASQLAFGLW